MLLAVNYHYISTESRPRARAIFPVSVADFAAQIDELGRHFEFVSRDDVVRAVEGLGSLPARACLITFDDGLRQQAELALPVLQERGVPAVFFVCAQPVEEQRPLFVHKVHYLREAMPDRDLLSALEIALAARGEALEGVSEVAAQAAYRYDAPEAARLKYLLNVVLGSRRGDIVDELFAARFDEKEFCDELYLTPGQVAALAERAALGAHGYSHHPLAVLGPVGARADVERGAHVLQRIGGGRLRAFSYPYGGASAVDEAVALEVAAAGFAFALTMERAFNQTLEEPMLLARLDANDAPGGKQPLFAVDGEELLVEVGMTPGRLRYLDELAA